MVVELLPAHARAVVAIVPTASAVDSAAATTCSVDCDDPDAAVAAASRGDGVLVFCRGQGNQGFDEFVPPPPSSGATGYVGKGTEHHMMT